MRKILILGAGRSSSSLIQYLLDGANEQQWSVRIGDADAVGNSKKFSASDLCTWFVLDATNQDQYRMEVEQADLVISMLPASMHYSIALACLDFGKHLITPSYVSDEMQNLHEAASSKNILFLNEVGLDPGLDHMSAMAIIDEVHSKGGIFSSFESFTGGLVAPGSDTNPWHYKISWNPRNIVMAGAGGTAKYLLNGHYNYIPYHQLFKRTTKIEIENHGVFEGYANRDSLKYRNLYALDSIPSLIRGTLRKSPFCEGWSIIVDLGLTDESFVLDEPEKLSWCNLLCALTGTNGRDQLKSYLSAAYDISEEVFGMLDWLGLFSDQKVAIGPCTPAVALQALLEKGWQLQPHDQDMVVMFHRFMYTLNGEKIEHTATLVDMGIDSVHTSMARTVGLPVGIAAKAILNGEVHVRGVQLPLDRNLYQLILTELLTHGIKFTESHRTL